MGSLFWNKVFGAIIGVGLIIMGFLELSHVLVHPKSPSQPAIFVDLSEVAVAAEDEVIDEGPTDYGLLLASADISAGERVSRRCASCHTFDEGGANMTGPAMWDVMGRAVAGVDGYGYSSAMEEYGSDGTVWGFENMYAYLERPSDYVPGTAMSFAGLRDQDDRINLLAYMRTLSANPIDFPAPLAAAEAAADVVEDVVDEVVEEVVEG